jgi:hypothetical protein
MKGERVSGFSCGQDQIQKLFQDSGSRPPDDVFFILIGVNDFLLASPDKLLFTERLFTE